MRVKGTRIGFRYELEESDIRSIRNIYMGYVTSKYELGQPEIWFQVLQDFLYQIDYEINYKLPYGQQNILWDRLDRAWLYKGRKPGI